jgi:hypothetical protein
MLMLAILGLGLCLGYWVNRAHEQRRAVDSVRAWGGWVHYADEFVMAPVKVPPGNALWKPSWGTLTPGKGPMAPDWLRRWLGDEYLRELVHVSLFVDIQKGIAVAPGVNKPPVDDVLQALGAQSSVRTLHLGGDTVTKKGLASVARMTDLRELVIWWALAVDDGGVAQLSRLPRLQMLDISNSAITDEGVGHLGTLPMLEELGLEGERFTDRSLAFLRQAKHLRSVHLRSDRSEISDEGLAALKGMNTLEELALEAPNVTDKGLEHLRSLKKLRRLYLGKSKVTKEARDQLQKDIPALTILP